jgi:hypothetical protein
MEKKVHTLEEENSVMKSFFYIKINSFVEEIDHLKSRLSSKLPFVALKTFLWVEYEVTVPEIKEQEEE